jgi:hypothetical protein
LEELHRRLRGEYSQHLDIKSLEDAATFVDALMASADNDLLLRWFLNDVEIGGGRVEADLSKIHALNGASLEAVLPFTAFCLRVALIFHFSLAFGLISTRATNRIDWEYFYYTPFCWAFSSGDVLHRDLAPHILNDKNRFVSRDELKADLKRLAGWWASLDEKEMQDEQRRQGPPDEANSVTTELWKKHMKFGYRERIRPDVGAVQGAAKEMLDELRKAVKGGKRLDEPLKLKDCEFFVTTEFMRLDGPCFCGSTRQFGECCGRGLVPDAYL